jgi:hypothetical protein
MDRFFKGDGPAPARGLYKGKAGFFHPARTAQNPRKIGLFHVKPSQKYRLAAEEQYKNKSGRRSQAAGSGPRPVRGMVLRAFGDIQMKKTGILLLAVFLAGPLCGCVSDPATSTSEVDSAGRITMQNPAVQRRLWLNPGAQFLNPPAERTNADRPGGAR